MIVNVSRALACAALLPLAAALTLSACNKPDVEAKNESVGSVAKKVEASGFKINPGHWDTTMKFVKMDVPGAPPEAQAMMGKMLGKDRTFGSCLTPEEAAKPGGKFFGQDNKSCTYDHFTMGDGKIDAKLTCHGGPGGADGKGQQTIVMNGTYDPDSYAMNMKMDMTGAGMPGAGGGEGRMTMEMAMSAKRAGACTGKEPS
jgi:hypothetical protein